MHIELTAYPYSSIALFIQPVGQTSLTGVSAERDRNDCCKLLLMAAKLFKETDLAAAGV